jgi:hypothetical protein
MFHILNTGKIHVFDYQIVFSNMSKLYGNPAKKSRTGNLSQLQAREQHLLPKWHVTGSSGKIVDMV